MVARRILPDSADFSLPIRYILTELGRIVKEKRNDVS